MPAWPPRIVRGSPSQADLRGNVVVGHGCQVPTVLILYCNVVTTSCLLQYLEKNSLGQINIKASLVVYIYNVIKMVFYFYTV